MVPRGPGGRARVAGRERFYFRDGRGAAGDEPPNNWQAIFGGSAWTRVDEPDGSPGQWYLAVFTPAQPDLDWNHPDVVDHFDRMLRFWFDRGVDGFRADAVTVVGKTPGLPDNEAHQGARRRSWARRHAHFFCRPEGHAVWRHWRHLVDAYEADHPGRQVVLVAEAYTPRRPDVMRQYANDEEFHQSFAFDLMLAPWNAEAYRGATIATVEALMPAGLLPAWTLNNHDAQRAVTRFGRADAATHGSEIEGVLESSQAAVDIDVGTRRARAAALFQFGLPGCVYLYAGEELGLPEVLDLPDEARQDPVFARTGGAELGRDGCRVPLPWTDDAGTSFGFSPRGESDPWLPQPKEWGRWNAADRGVRPGLDARALPSSARRPAGDARPDVGRVRAAAPRRSGPRGVPARRDRRRAQHVRPRARRARRPRHRPARARGVGARPRRHRHRGTGFGGVVRAVTGRRQAPAVS